MAHAFVAARQVNKPSPALGRAGWVCEPAGQFESCAGCPFDNDTIPTGDQLWIEPGDPFTGEADTFCRRCAFDRVVHSAAQWDAGFRRRRPWVGLDLQVVQSIRRAARRVRRRRRA